MEFLSWCWCLNLSFSFLSHCCSSFGEEGVHTEELDSELGNALHPLDPLSALSLPFSSHRLRPVLPMKGSALADRHEAELYVIHGVHSETSGTE